MKPAIYHEVPKGFLDVLPRDLGKVLDGPSLLVLPGKRKQPLFVSILLHGNEHTSLFAVQALLKRYQNKQLPRAMIIFIGNVAATRRNARRLPNQVDYNRVWGVEGDSEEHKLADFVLNFARDAKPFASIDIHNNTGTNPHYGCVNLIDHESLALASLFSNTMVYFTKPSEVQAIAFSKICPSTTIECGLSGEWHGVERAIHFLDKCLHLKSLRDVEVGYDCLDLYHTVARVKLPKSCLFDFGGQNPDVDLRFPDNFEHLNFVEQPQDTLLGWRFHDDLRLLVEDNMGRDVAHEFLYYENKEIRVKTALTPSMFTKDRQVAVIDCLGYFMLRYPLPRAIPHHAYGTPQSATSA